MNTKILAYCACAAALTAAAHLAAADAVTVTVGSANGSVRANTFAGLSFGTVMLEENHAGTGYFFDTNTNTSPHCLQVVNLCNNMGVHHIRIGGASVDYTVPPNSQGVSPNYTYDGIDAFFSFINAIGGQTIFSLRYECDCVNNVDYSTDDAAIAGHIWNDNIPTTQIPEQGLLDTFALGNEPQFYEPGQAYACDNCPITGFKDYENRWLSIAGGVVGATASTVGFGAVDDAQGNAYDWTTQFITAKHTGSPVPVPEHIFLATQHFYSGASAKNVSKETAIQYELGESSPTPDKQFGEWMNTYANNWYNWNFRITEADDYYTGGVSGASNAFVSAMFTLDYLGWFSEQPACEGLNFHETWGDYTDTIYADSQGNYQANPKWAAFKMFSLMYPGTTTNRNLSLSGATGDNATYYASSDSSNVYVLVINRTSSYEGDSVGINVTVKPPSGFTATNAEYIKMLSSPTDNDPAQPAALVGGSGCANTAGGWTGTWTSTAVSSNSCTVTASECSAVLIRLYK